MPRKTLSAIPETKFRPGDRVRTSPKARIKRFAWRPGTVWFAHYEGGRLVYLVQFGDGSQAWTGAGRFTEDELVPA